MFEWIVASFVGSTCISVLAAFLLMRRYSGELQTAIEPQLESMKELVFEVQGALDHAKPQIARTQSIIAQHGTTPRQIKTAERMVAKDLVDQYPEIEALVGAISPRTQEYFTENPDILLEIVSRWGPKIAAILGEKGLEGVLPGLQQQGSSGSRGREWAWQE
ncbi:unnamed protein product [marine sediment metagenome]|uniref:Uncharacterized protein n=1 Tax=marine sediment metagenome TaxID=412755 RepID=X1E9B0_9ZZZZ